MYLRVIDAAQFSGPINGCAPTPVTNGELSRALGRALHRPALVPVPGVVARIMVGEVAKYAVTGVRMVRGRARLRVSPSRDRRRAGRRAVLISRFTEDSAWDRR